MSRYKTELQKQKAREWARQDRKNNPEKYKKIDEYRKNHTDWKKVYKRRRVKAGEIGKSRKWNKVTYHRNRDYYLQKAKDYRKKNWQKKRQDDKIYRQTHSKQYLEYGKKYMKTHDLPHPRILLSWSAFIKTRDKICKNCNNMPEFAHHILYRSLYPKLAMNENNGIALCKKCHYEVHGWRFVAP